MNVPINDIRNTTIQRYPAPVSSQLAQGYSFSPFGSIAATLTIASAASIGSNLVDVRNGTLSLSLALLNGVAKGAAASYIFSKTTRSTTGEILVAAGFLAGAAYLIDAKMKKIVKSDSVDEGLNC